ncbi:MAG TPA: hypothetical protein VGR77_07995 [Candidatus Dormibacteraeota bacterium]|nr:hypothetical protein [Candidatus Dormibacteraeota bacterium]
MEYPHTIWTTIGMRNRLPPSVVRAFGLDNVVSNVIWGVVWLAVSIVGSTVVGNVVRWQLPSLIALGFALFLLLAAAGLGWRQHHLTRSPPLAVSGSASRWELLPESDDSNMPNLIHHLPQSAQTAVHLTAVDPYVDLDFGFVNASVFDLTFSRAEGRIRYQGRPLQQALEPLTGQLIVIRHGEGRGFTLRQWISHGAAAQMLAEISGNGVGELAPGYVGLYFTYSNHKGTPREVRIGLGGAFTIGPGLDH